MSRALTGAGESLRQAGHYAGWRQWGWAGVSGFLEAYNGQYFFNLPEKKSQTSGANDPVWEQAA